MNKNRFLALTMAGAMTLATAVPAFAAGDSGTTKVSVTVVQPNEYTMTVPAATTLNSDGTATQLTNGITIAGGTLEADKKLTVTATSANSWKMSATGKDTTIGYKLYSNESATTEATSWEFTQDEAETGASKDVYAKADADDLKAAASGTYSDTITFTAKVESATPMVSFTFGGTPYQVTQGTTWRKFVSEKNISVEGWEIWEETYWQQKKLDDEIVAGTYALNAPA